jgi:hypothetical protein
LEGFVLNTYDILKEFALIRRGLHRGYEGDTIANASGFLWRIRDQNEAEAEALANDIERNAEDVSSEIGLSPYGVRAVVSVLRGQANEV